MSKHFNLVAEQRQRSGSSAINRMRREGFIPAVIYGSSKENVNLKVHARTLRDVLQQSASDNILIDLEIEGESKPTLALIQDIQHDHLKGGILHVDFHAVREDEEIHASVPLDLSGTPIGVKNGGLMDQMIYALEVHCLPKNLPATIPVNIEELDIGDSVHVGDIDGGEGVELVLEDDVVVLMVTETRAALSEGDGADGEEGEEGEGAEGEGEGSEGGEGSAEGGDDAKGDS